MKQQLEHCDLNPFIIKKNRRKISRLNSAQLNSIEFDTGAPKTHFTFYFQINTKKLFKINFKKFILSLQNSNPV